jgi:transcriptional regulator with XRE-family HTH domain
MPKPSSVLYPSERRLLQDLGQRVKDARLRRRFSAETVSVRADISRPTLSKIEAGDPAVTFGNYVRVLSVLGLAKDLELVAKDDEVGRRLQDTGLPHRRRAPKRNLAGPKNFEGIAE